MTKSSQVAEAISGNLWNRQSKTENLRLASSDFELILFRRYKYRVGMGDYVKRPSLYLSEFFDLKLLRESFRLQMFSSQSAHVRSFFSHPDLVSIMEWPVLFLGGAPTAVPALYSLINYAAIGLGTWYPKVRAATFSQSTISRNGAVLRCSDFFVVQGGLAKVPAAMRSLAEELGVSFFCGEQYGVTRIRYPQSLTAYLPVLGR